MADLIINGTTYSGSPIDTSHPQRPAMPLQRRVLKIGRLFKAKNGALTWVHRAIKHEWTVGWDRANPTTQAAVLALRNLTTTFAFVDVDGVSYTVITTGDDTYEEGITSSKSNAYRYDLSLVLREV